MKKFKSTKKYSFFVIVTILIISMVSMVVYSNNLLVPNLNIDSNNTNISINRGGCGKAIYNVKPQPFTSRSEENDVVLILDTSQTMKGNIEQAKNASINFVEKILGQNKNIKVGLVSYNGSAQILSGLTNNKLDILKKIDLIFNDKYINLNGEEVWKNMNSHLGTNAGDAFRLALNIFNNKENNNAKKTVIFMTNGKPNAYTGIFYDGINQENKEFNYDWVIDKYLPIWNGNNIPEDYKKFFNKIFSDNVKKIYGMISTMGDENYKYDNSLDKYFFEEYNNIKSDKIDKMWFSNRLEHGFYKVFEKYNEIYNDYNNYYNYYNYNYDYNWFIWNYKYEYSKEKTYKEYVEKLLYDAFKIKEENNIFKGIYFNFKNPYEDYNNPSYYLNFNLGYNYAIEMAKIMRKENITNYSIYFGKTNTKDGKVRYATVYEIAKAAGADEDNIYHYEKKKIGDEVKDNLDDIFEKLKGNIENEKIISAKLRLNLPKGIEVLDNQINYNGKTIKVNSDGTYNINIKYAKDGDEFKANQFPIEIKYKEDSKSNEKVKNYTVYGDIIFDNRVIKLPVINITSEKQLSVDINVSDSRGSVGKQYNSLSIKENNNSYDLLGDKNSPNVLFGQGYSKIKVNGLDYKENRQYFLHYAFKNGDDIAQDKSGNKYEGYLPIDSEGNIINTSDVNINKPGYLTTRSYNVEHLEAGNTKQWSKMENIFLNPLGKKPIDLPTNPIAKSSGQYLSGDNRKTVFFDRLDLGRNYTEANKYWGYIKPEHDGWYILGGIADDGINAYINKNGDKINFVEHKWGLDYYRYSGDDNGFDLGYLYNKSNFIPHRPTYYSNFKPIYLKANEYYPIYIEYYNYTDAGVFELTYNYYENESDAKVLQKKLDVNSIYEAKSNISDKEIYNFINEINIMGGENKKFIFYPSKSLEPGETATTTFSGEYDLKLPSEEGIYSIEYTVVSKEKNKFENLIKGNYGYFKVEKIFNAIIDFDSDVYYGKRMNVYYEIKPNYINANQEEKYKTLYIRNITVTGFLPKGLKFLDNGNGYNLNSNSDFEIKYPSKETDSGTNFTIRLKNPIIYNLQGDKYIWDEKSGKFNNADKNIRIPIAVKVSNNKKSFVFEKSQNILTYTCQDSKDLITQYFEENYFTLKQSTITKIGLLDYDSNTNKSVINENANNIAGGIPSKVAVEVYAKSPETSVILKIDKGTINHKKLKLYEVDENNNIISTKIDIGENNIEAYDNGKSIKINLNNILNKNNFVEKKYVIVSEIITPKVEAKENSQSLNVTASIENNPNSTKNKEFISGEMPDVF